jgi:hypothetical protein
MYAGVDCRSEDGTVLLFEPNPGDPHAAWSIDTPSLAAWLENYYVIQDSAVQQT